MREHASAGQALRGAFAGCFSRLCVEDPERLSPEVGSDVFDGFSIAYLILLLGHVSQVGCKDSIIKPHERVIWW
jgi:hypothetical protein